MGNRACFAEKGGNIEVYIQFGGSRNVVESILQACRLCGYVAPNGDENGWARLCQLLGNYFGSDGLHVGIQSLVRGADYLMVNNGLYVLDGWDIADRVYPYEGFAEQRELVPEDLAARLAAWQPKRKDACAVSGKRCAMVSTLERKLAVTLPCEAQRLVPAIVAWCKTAGWREPGNPNNPRNGWARVLQVACNVLDSLGMGDYVKIVTRSEALKSAAGGETKVWAIGQGWQVDGAERPSLESLLEVDAAMPADSRFTTRFTSEKVPLDAVSFRGIPNDSRTNRGPLR